MTRPRGGPLMGVLLALLVVVSIVPAGSAVDAPDRTTAAQQSTTQDDGVDPADEIFVKKNGDAVLAYDQESTSTGTPANGQFGIDISSNLMYLLVTQPVQGQSSATGDASLLLTDTKFSGNGSLSVMKPRLLQSFSMELSGQSTAQNAKGSLSLDATATVPPSVTQSFESASTSGTIETTASQFTANGKLNANLALPQGSQPERSVSVDITESNGGYTVTVDRNTPVFSFGSSQWETRAKAKQTLQEQYQLNAQQYDASATITIDEYSYTSISGNQYRLDIAYTVQYQNLEGAIAEAIAQNLTTDPSMDLSQQQADEFASRIQNLQINRVSASYNFTPDQATANFNVDIDNYDQAILAFLNIAQAANPEGMSSLQSLDRVRKQLEAQSAANLQQTYTWNGQVSKPGSTSLKVTLDANYETSNWQTYVQELKNRGIELPETTYQFSGGVDGDQLVFDGTFSITGNLVERFTNQMANATQGDTQASQMMSALLDADFQKAKMDLSVNESTVVIRAGAKFKNLAALRDTLAKTSAVPSGVTSVVARPSESGTRTYVTVKNAVSSDASKSDVRNLAYVGPDTTINMPGDWDREFPSMNTQRAAEYLSVQADGGSGGGGDGNTGNASGNASGNKTTTTSSTGFGPGFGVGLSVIALLASAALLARRQ